MIPPAWSIGREPTYADGASPAVERILEAGEVESACWRPTSADGSGRGASTRSAAGCERHLDTGRRPRGSRTAAAAARAAPDCDRRGRALGRGRDRAAPASAGASASRSVVESRPRPRRPRRRLRLSHRAEAARQVAADRPARSTALLQQPRQPAVLEHPAAGLALRAVVGLVLGEVDGLDRRPAARARLALAAVDLERHRQLVGDLSRRPPPRSGRSPSPSTRERGVQALDLLVVEVRALAKRRQLSPPRGSRRPSERPMPAIARWSRSSGCRWRGWSIAAASASQRRRRPGLGPERRDHLVGRRPRPARSSFAQARCLVPNSRRRSSRPSASRIRTRERRSLSEARLSNTCSRPADIRWTRSSSDSSPPANVDHGHLADPPDAVDRHPLERRERRVERLHRDHPGRQRRLDLGARERGGEPAGGDLDFGQLGHRPQ